MLYINKLASHISRSKLHLAIVISLLLANDIFASGSWPEVMKWAVNI